MRVLGILASMTGALAFSKAAKNGLNTMPGYDEPCKAIAEKANIAKEKCERALSSFLPYSTWQDNHCELKERIIHLRFAPQYANCRYEVIKVEEGKEYKVFSQLKGYKTK
jgi:hypothetical protein